MKMLKTKVCGLRDKENVLQVAALKPDYIGFIFYEKSARYAGGADLEFINELSGTKKVAVFVNATEKEIDSILTRYSFDAVQLHGNERPEFCETIRLKGVELIKAFGVDSSFDFNQLKAYGSVVDYFLFDTKTRLHGGSGRKFDWDVLDEYKENIPYYLSGGIDKEAFRSASSLKDERLYCIDVNSCFELEPGVKSIPLLQTILK